MSRLLCPIQVNPCDCGCRYVTMETDGISDRYNCDECGALLADLITNVEL